MAQTRVVCRDDECPDSMGRSQHPPALRCTGETRSAWTFVCDTCAKAGRVSMRVVTKDQLGGMFGVGRRDDGTGPHGGKGPDRYRPGWRPA